MCGKRRRAAGGSTASKSPLLTSALHAQRRGYVAKRGGALEATPRGRLLAAFLGAYFGRYVDYGFTASLEASLDAVSGARSQRRTACMKWTRPWVRAASAAQPVLMRHSRVSCGMWHSLVAVCLCR